jgi:putative hemolysin
MSSTLIQVLIIVLLILMNGIFAMSEISIVSSRKARLEQWAKEGNAGAKAALLLISNPDVFLATIQIGMTVTAILTGVFGGATIADTLAQSMSYIPALKPYASSIGFGLVVVTISYFTLILGELTPKRIGLANAEKMACLIGPPMWWLSQTAAPVVKLLNYSSDLVVKALGVKRSTAPPITTDEIKLMLEHGTEAGVFQEAEEDMVKGVLRLGARPVTALMTPRPKLIWLDKNDTHQNILTKLAISPPTRLLVAEDDVDHLHGYVFTRQVLAQPVFSKVVDLNACLKQPLFVPETTTALQVLEMFKNSGTHIAVILDEYGNVQGVITMTDMLKAIVGEIDFPERPSNATLHTPNCSWLLDGFLPIDQLKEMMGVSHLAMEAEAKYQTLAGFLIQQKGSLPGVGDQVEYGEYRFCITAMSGRRVAKVGVAFIGDSPESEAVPRNDLTEKMPSPGSNGTSNGASNGSTENDKSNGKRSASKQTKPEQKPVRVATKPPGTH